MTILTDCYNATLCSPVATQSHTLLYKEVCATWTVLLARSPVESYERLMIHLSLPFQAINSIN
jgi:hypothetical protein